MATPFDAPVLMDPTYQSLSEQDFAWVQMQAWIEHWSEDRRCNLLPTEGSLARASSLIARQRHRIRGEINALLREEERAA